MRAALPRERFSPLALFGLGSLSDLSPLCAQKRELNVTTIWITPAICGVALIGAAAFWG
jgi:hypothetical protein